MFSPYWMLPVTVIELPTNLVGMLMATAPVCGVPPLTEREVTPATALDGGMI
jgi:hypothetical protein